MPAADQGVVNPEDSTQFIRVKGSHFPKDSKLIRRLDSSNNIVMIPVRDSTGVQSNKSGNDWKKIGDSLEVSNYFYVRFLSTITPSLANSAIRLVQFDSSRNLMVVEATWKELEMSLLNHPAVLSVQSSDRMPKVESQIRRHNLSVNGIRLLHNEKPDLKGLTINCSIKEDAFDQNDLDIATRTFLDEKSSAQVTSHATDVATLVGGAGNSFATGKGVATAVNLYSESFTSLLPQSNDYFINKAITVQNHSYGVGIENFYSIESVSFDQQALELPSLLHVFSAGNSGLSESNGKYAGIFGVANLTGSFKQAKNVLVVTGSLETGLVPAVNSMGPAYDGRIRPELTAYGNEGTSGAAAIVSGAAVLIQEHFKSIQGMLPYSDMVRAMLIAGSSDIESPGPDYKSGYGAMNLPRTMKIIDAGWYAKGKLSSESSMELNIVVPEQKKRLTVALVWRDPPANEGDFMALVNDLDLHVSKNGNVWMPWVLDTAPDLAALLRPATYGEDHLNTVELVTIENVDEGTYSIHVSANAMAADQEFSLAYYLEDEEEFKWLFPTGSDALLAGTETYLYWENNYDNIGSLEIEYVNHGTEAISTEILPDQSAISFTPPIAFTQALLRMNIGGKIYKSDTFTIAPDNNLRVDLNCADQFILSWDRVADDLSYEVLAYADGLLKPITVTNDTVVLFTKKDYPGSHYTVRSVIGNYRGLADATIRIDQQGIGCFLNNFLVTLTNDDIVKIQLDLSGLSFIDRVTIVKNRENKTEVIFDGSPETPLMEINDLEVLPGKTLYHAEIFPRGLDKIKSEELPIYFTDEATFLLFPNPVSDDYFYFLSPETDSIFQLLNSVGQVIYEYEILSELEIISLSDYPPGLYLYRVIKESSVLHAGRLIRM